MRIITARYQELLFFSDALEKDIFFYIYSNLFAFLAKKEISGDKVEGSFI